MKHNFSRAIDPNYLLDIKIAYWINKLQGLEPLELPADFTRPAVPSRKGAVATFQVNKELARQLQELSHQQGTTLFVTLLAAFKVLLYRYSGQKDICVGSPVANRTQHEVEGLIGFFVNTLALRTEVNSELTFMQLLQQVRVTTMEAHEHQEVPFEKVVESIVKQRDPSRNPIFQVMLMLQNNSNLRPLRSGVMEVVQEDYENATTQLDITVSISPSHNGLEGSVQYATDLYKEETIVRMIDHFKNLLGSIVKTPLQTIGKLALLSMKEEEQLLYQFNDTKVGNPINKNIIDLFEEQVTKTPNAIAIVFEGSRLTYTELNERANQLAHHLVARGIKEESLIPICIEPSFEMIVGIFGILKAGGAYVPIDPQYPQERISYILEDIKATIAVTGRESSSKLPGVEKLELDRDWKSISTQPLVNLQKIVQPHNLAYVIYTSGSTGKPKGVMIEHRSLSGSTLSRKDYYKNHKSCLLIYSFAFDASVAVIFGTLLKGSRLILCKDQQTKHPKKKKKLLKDTDTIDCVPSYYDFLLQENLIQNSNVSTVIVGGEKLDGWLVEKHFQETKRISLYNEYGPTEGTVWATVAKVEPDSNLVTIGKPINNVTVYILNKDLQLVPVGVPGELCIGGVQVARGYLNLPRLTEEKFITDPFSADGLLMYRTGDRARWLADGSIEYLGRIDEQVKIRGYRIETGEIETILQHSGLVRQAVVLVKEDNGNNKQLVGYIIPEGSFDQEAIVSYLKNKLPGYMVPALWVELDNLPLTHNGKADKKALLNLDESVLLRKDYVAPQNDMEAALVKIWKKLLRTQQVSIQDNFFELGGHSLLAMRLLSAIHREFGVEVSLADIFESTIQSLASKISIQLHKTYLARGGSQLTDGNSLIPIQTLELTERIETGIIEWSYDGKGKYLIPINKDGRKIPFFGIISFSSYRLLSSFLPKDQPLYYLPPTESASVEEIAAHYIKEIKLIQPVGPYCIGGFCAAGAIALEIARQLQASGGTVAALVLFEFYSEQARMSKKSFTYVKRKIAKYINRLVNLNKAITSPLHLSKYLINKSFAKFKEGLWDRTPPRYITTPEYNQYVFKPYCGKVVLFQASIPPLEFNGSPLMGWSDYFTGEVEVISIEGGHLGMLKTPAVGQVAERLNTVFENINITK